MTPEIYQMLVIKQALQLYAKHGIRVNRAYTPRAMIQTAERLTGRHFNRDYLSAAKALGELIEEKSK